MRNDCTYLWRGNSAAGSCSIMSSRMHAHAVSGDVTLGVHSATIAR